MQDLMRSIGFSVEELDTVEKFRYRLESKGIWKTIQQLAEEVLQVHPCADVLRTNLKKAEAMAVQAALPAYSMDLLLILQCACLLRFHYQKLGYDEKLYVDAMKDIMYKMHECQKVYGVTGIFVGSWYDGFFDMTRFALGRLQFEKTQLWLEEPILVDGWKCKHGDTAINIHIPSGAKLTVNAAKEAFALAAQMFRDEFADDPVIFVMASWLLDRDLISLLPEGNLRKFVERFFVVRDKKNDVFLDGWRVFDADWEKQPDQLPGETRLQRAIRDYLQRGGKLGDGYGVMVWRS